MHGRVKAEKKDNRRRAYISCVVARLLGKIFDGWNDGPQERCVSNINSERELNETRGRRSAVGRMVRRPIPMRSPEEPRGAQPATRFGKAE